MSRPGGREGASGAPRDYAGPTWFHGLASSPPARTLAGEPEAAPEEMA